MGAVKYVIIPKNSEIECGDYVLITKAKIEIVDGEQKNVRRNESQ